jgi:phytoene dehydrogenase-like protein
MDSPTMRSDEKRTTDTDVIVIGSGIGGLCCAALLARYGYRVTVCEGHSIPGGAAHGFYREGYHFDSGPSFYSGLTAENSSNPLRQLLDLLGEEVPCVSYDSWICHLPEGRFTMTADEERYQQELGRYCSAGGLDEWRRLAARLERLSRGLANLPILALRGDAAVAVTLARYARSLLAALPAGRLMQRPFSWLVDQYVSDPFLRRMLDYDCFSLSGLPADGTLLAEMVFMFRERFRIGVEYPLGGSQAIVSALVRGLEKHGGELLLKAPVESIAVSGGRARGVVLGRGGEFTAEKAVVSNASIWDTLRLIPDGALPETYQRKAAATPQTESFMHLHLGIDATGLREDLGCHHSIVNHWEVTAPQNLCGISIPSVLDPSLAPEGRHVVHAYTAGNEPYRLWEGMDRRSTEYRERKEERTQVLWQALERVIPDIRERAEFVLSGSPLTHERFLRRDRGTYGPAIRAGKERFPGPSTPLRGLLRCGDSTAPGIGVPAAAASGIIAANTLAPVSKHWKLLNQV